MAFSTTAILGAFAAQCGLHGEKATYRVGNVALANLDVIPGQSQAEAIGESGLVSTIDLQDFQLRAGDLVLPGETPQPFIPDRGHILEVLRGDQVHQFVVSHPDGNQAPFRRADAYGAVLRVHTLVFTPPTPVEETPPE